MHGLLFLVGLIIILTGFFIPLNPIAGLQIPTNVALPIIGGLFMIPALARMRKR